VIFITLAKFFSECGASFITGGPHQPAAPSAPSGKRWVRSGFRLRGVLVEAVYFGGRGEHHAGLPVPDVPVHAASLSMARGAALLGERVALISRTLMKKALETV
jgi:hypothetical protein